MTLWAQLPAPALQQGSLEQVPGLVLSWERCVAALGSWQGSLPQKGASPHSTTGTSARLVHSVPTQLKLSRPYFIIPWYLCKQI